MRLPKLLPILVVAGLASAIAAVSVGVIGAGSIAVASAGPPDGAFKTPFTVFRGRTTNVKMSISLVEHRIGFDAHARVSCADGSSHWQLLIEGGLGGRVDGAGRFHHTEYEPAEDGEVPPVTRRVTIEEEEEGVRYGFPAELRGIKGRVLPNRVVGSIRYWEGPGKTPKSVHFRCGTATPEGDWLKFSLPRVNGPAQAD
ncbi:MAG TPA: hypothetical protein VJL81_07005 [Solirubrobacterales bacterium]|nr:hypothetical protein [Solirubrobacterales bacterium]